MICKIRKWLLSDAEDLTVAISNKKVQDNLRDGIPYPYTVQDGINFISAMLSADENDTFAFAITVDEKAIGSIGVYRQENIHRQTAELGYYIAEEYWGKGIMTEAIKQICQHVFQKSDIIRIYAEPFAYNIASCRALEKAGFQYEGTLRNNAVKNGKVIDNNVECDSFYFSITPKAIVTTGRDTITGKRTTKTFVGKNEKEAFNKALSFPGV